MTQRYYLEGFGGQTVQVSGMQKKTRCQKLIRAVGPIDADVASV